MFIAPNCKNPERSQKPRRRQRKRNQTADAEISEGRRLPSGAGRDRRKLKLASQVGRKGKTEGDAV
jgi:hypothetical protein